MSARYNAIAKRKKKNWQKRKMYSIYADIGTREKCIVFAVEKMYALRGSPIAFFVHML